MLKHSFSDFSYAVNTTSEKKGQKEILVCFMYNGKEVLKKVYIPEAPGMSYIFEARKIIDQEIKNGSLSAYSHKFVKRNAKKNAAPKKKTDVKATAPVPTGGFNGKKVAIIAIAAALVVGAIAGVATYFLTKPAPEEPPAPITSYDVAFSSKNCNFDGKNEAAAGEPYSCNVFPKGDISNTYEVVIESVFMDGVELIEGESKDYYFRAPELKINKPVTGNITITATAQLHTFNVYCSHEGCEFLAEGGTDPAPNTAARNAQYKCVFKPTAITDHVVVSGVLMGGDFLEANDNNGYSFDEGSGLLTIKKYTDANISIVAEAVPNEPTEYSVYTKYVDCAAVSVEEKAIVGQDYVCKIKPNDSVNYKASIASVAIGGVIVAKSSTTYTESVDSSGVVTLTIESEIIKGEVSITAVAVRATQTPFSITHKDDGSCIISHAESIESGATLECRITPTTAGDTPRIVAVIMGDRVLDNSEYATAMDEGDLVLTVPAVLGDLNIFAIAESPEANASKKMMAIVANGCKIDGSKDNLDIQEIPESTPGAFTISAALATNWVNVVSVSSGSRKLYSVTDYIYNCEPDGEFKFVEGLAVSDDVVVVAQAIPAANTSFMVDHYAFGCSYDGAKTVKLKDGYSETIVANDPEKYQPTVKIVMGGTVLTAPNDYSFEKKENEDVFELKIKENVIKNDLSVFIMNVDKDRASFNVDCYRYECDFACSAYPDNKVPTGTTNYTATITGKNGLVPSIDCIYMGNKRLNVVTDFTFSVIAGTGTLIIKTAVTSDIVIYATAQPANWQEAIAECTLEGGVMTATSLKADADIKDITKVTIPNEFEPTLTNEPVSVEGIKEGLLNGCSSIQTLETPFIGISKTSAAENYYDHIIGKVFGSAMYEGVGTLTWQEFYSTEDPTKGVEGGYKIAKAAIPLSLSKIILNDDSATIPAGAFTDCSNIESVEYMHSSTVDKVGPYAFADCSSLKYVTLPEQALNTIGRHAFENCSLLQTVSIPKINTIEHDAFANCHGIRQIIIPDSIQKVGDNAFTGLTSSGMVIITKTRQQVKELQASGWSTNWVDDATFVIYGSSGDLTFYTDEATNDFRFILVKNDAGGTIGACIAEYIGDDYATELTIPATVKATISGTQTTYKVFEIGSQVFYGFTRFKKITFEQPANDTNDLEVIGNYCFTACPAVEKIVGLESLTKLKYIGAYAFDRCTSLGVDKSTSTAVSVVLPSSVNEIGKYAFAYCYSLTDIDLSDTAIDSIPEKLFYCSGVNVDYTEEAEATGLVDIEIADDFTVSLPSSGTIKDLGSSAFQINQDELGEDGTFDSRLKTLSIVGSDDVKAIPDNFCSGCSELDSFSLTSSNNLTSIGNYAFNGCALTSLSLNDSTNTLSDNVTYVGDCAFANNKISAFTLGSNLPTSLKFGYDVFKGWTGSQAVNISFAMLTSNADTALVYTNWGWTMGNVQALASFLSNEYRCGNSGSVTLPFYTF